MTSPIHAKHALSINLVELLALGWPFIIANGEADEPSKSSKTDIDKRADDQGTNIAWRSGQETDKQTSDRRADKRKRSGQKIKSGRETEKETRNEGADDLGINKGTANRNKRVDNPGTGIDVANGRINKPGSADTD